MEACYGGTDVMGRSCAVARGIDINNLHLYSLIFISYQVPYCTLTAYGTVR
jgi:hypothetical protein